MRPFRSIKPVTVLLLTMSLAIAGCGEAGGGSRSDNGSRAGDGAEPELARECSNPEARYSVRYPADWHVNPGDVASPCSYFHPQPIDLEPATEATGIAISVRREPVSFELATGEGPDKLLKSRELEIDGRRAMRQERRSAGRGLLPKGIRIYHYVVDLGNGETLIASTVEEAGLKYERNQEVLDEMAGTLQINGG